jgi:1-acyl-sn-glycerol-3-phosphate acyltransferase
MNSIYRWFLNNVIRLGTDFLCRIDKADISKIPSHGPLILVTNHINSLEVPLLFVHLQPRRMIGLAKIETWNNKFMGWLFDLWDAIPIHRGTLDLEAFRACLGTLEAGDILAIAPEGTRSYDGKLQCGQPGAALIALHSEAPILPIAHWGGELFGSNLKKLRRTDFHFKVGKPFYLDAHGEKVNGKVRQGMVDEIMSQIALLMPVEYRGNYIDCDLAPQNYLRFA